jgi:hypothetical protein
MLWKVKYCTCIFKRYRPNYETEVATAEKKILEHLVVCLSDVSMAMDYG